MDNFFENAELNIPVIFGFDIYNFREKPVHNDSVAVEFVRVNHSEHRAFGSRSTCVITETSDITNRDRVQELIWNPTPETRALDVGNTNECAESQRRFLSS